MSGNAKGQLPGGWAEHEHNVFKKQELYFRFNNKVHSLLYSINFAV